MKNLLNIFSKYYFIIYFVLGFTLIPFAQLNGFRLMPGDLGDARLNNYFLENIFQFLRGNSPSLWHLQFFWPFPYTGGFSDNLFGSSPIYLIARMITNESDTAYQIWFLSAYPVNYIAAYYSFRKLGMERKASTAGAIIFTFSLPVQNQAIHAQLLYRFGFLLSLINFMLFLRSNDPWKLIKTFFWMVWQFYCGLYMGFFTIVFIFTMLMIAFLLKHHQKIPRNWLNRDMIRNKWEIMPKKSKQKLIFASITIFVSLILYFYPYFQVSNLFGYPRRPWFEISLMLPRIGSYFLADASSIWNSKGVTFFSSIPMRHEHQLFVGLLPTLLFFFGVKIGFIDKRKYHFYFLLGALSVLILFTLSVFGFSYWFIVHFLPLFSSIRSISRIILAFLFPIAFIGALTVQFIDQNIEKGRIISSLIIMPLLLAEPIFSPMKVSEKVEWRERIVRMETQLPKEIGSDAVLFFPQTTERVSWDIDAMWIGLINNIPVMNGYSGLYPPGYSLYFGDDCEEMITRINAYLIISESQINEEIYEKMIRRITPLGFDNCDQNWLDGNLGVKDH